MQPGYQPDTVIIGESTPQMGQATTSPFGATGAIVATRPMQMMSFMDSIKKCLINNYAGFSGRASRSEYWWFILATYIGAFPLGFVDAILFGWEYDDPMWLSNIYNLALILPTLAAAVRRIHDHGKSGWFILVPFYNLYLVIADGEGMPNAYGPVPTNQLH
jgi:uncharacterized membrane protein YhaH (DUF805 family)